MIALLLATNLSLVQLPTQVQLPHELAYSTIQTVVQATQTHFVAENTSEAVQLLLFGTDERGLVSHSVLQPGAKVSYPFPRGSMDELLLEIVSLDRDAWNNTGALSIAEIRESHDGALWVEATQGYAIGWSRGDDYIVHMAPSSGLVPRSLLRTEPEDIYDFAFAPARHVPVITPDGRKTRRNRPPVIDDKPLPPV
jgi:hypothetical protein